MSALLKSCLPKLGMLSQEYILEFVSDCFLEDHVLPLRTQLRGDQYLAMRHLLTVLRDYYVIGATGPLDDVEKFVVKSAKIHHPLLYTVFDKTFYRLFLNNRLLIEGYDWDAMEQYCIEHHPELAGVLGPQEDGSVLSIRWGNWYTEKQVNKCFGNVMCRVMSHPTL